MNRRILDRDAQTGVTTWHSYDAHMDTSYIEEVQDVQPYLEIMRSLQNDAVSGRLNDYERKGIKNDRMHVACIPVGVQLKWLKDHGINLGMWGRCPETTKRIKRLLNSPDWRYLRTGNARL